MRVSLQRVSARIDRLAKQAHLSEDDLLAKCEAMSDEELGIEYLRLIEMVVGPATTFESDDAFVAAIVGSELAAEGLSPAVLEMCRGHWRRIRWFRMHETHGPLTFVPHGCIRPAT